MTGPRGRCEKEGVEKGQNTSRDKNLEKNSEKVEKNTPRSSSIWVTGGPLTAIWPWLYTGLQPFGKNDIDDDNSSSSPNYDYQARNTWKASDVCEVWNICKAWNV